MLDIAGINIWAVAVVWLLFLFVGALWYSPLGFAKKWTKYTGIDILKIPTDKATQILVFIAIASLVQVVTLAVVLNSIGAATAGEGLVAGLVLWLGLTTATTVGVTLYQKLSWKFLWLNAAYFLVVMSLGSMILAIWR